VTRIARIGVTAPLSGPLEAFGPGIRTGIREAIDQVNARGGLLGHTVELLVRDNASIPGRASAQARELIVDDGAIALIGGITPQLGIPLSVVAEQLQTPALLTVTPIRAWLGATESGWSWAWNFFFDELQMTQTQFLASDLLDTNKRVALFTDLEEDGIVMGGLWVDRADAFGYEIVYHAEFPVGTTEFESQVAEAQAADADGVIGQLMEAEGQALLRAIRTRDYRPTFVFLEKCANSGAWARRTGGLCEDTLAANWFAEGIETQREAEFIARYRSELGGVDSNLATIVSGYTAAAVLVDAVQRAGTLSPAAVNAEIGNTAADYPAGRIRFDSANACAMPAVMTQWRGDDMVLVMHADGSPGPAAIRPFAQELAPA
jgi:branched-chain amino acid transport system substrate-binding protein